MRSRKFCRVCKVSIKQRLRRGKYCRDCSELITRIESRSRGDRLEVGLPWQSAQSQIVTEVA
jgi:hypothetical protein